MKVVWQEETFQLLPERAVFRPRDRAVLVADLHLGKPAAFRAAGVPVPDGPASADLARLEAVLREHEGTRLIILGDLLHAREGRSVETLGALREWRSRMDRVEIVLVRGNHDARAGDPPAELGFVVVEEPWVDGGASSAGARTRRLAGKGLALRHTPAEDNAAPSICGHLHPMVSMSGGAGPGLRAPCFWFTPLRMVLPAFGSFTGGHSIRAREGDRVFATGPGKVVEVPTVVRRPASAR